MPLYRVTMRIDAPVERVWELLCDWEGSEAWMVDATTVEVLTPQREGVGTRVRAVTIVAGVPLTDEMLVTRWEPQRLIEVRHLRAPIKGVAWFELSPDGRATRFEWGEELDPPLGPLGELGGLIVRKPIERMLRRSAAKLRALAESV
jgi:carbon monoxide dehydrogenase subunit G